MLSRFVLPILEYCSAVWCLAANAHFELLERALSCSWFLTGGVFECDIAHHQSLAILCMMFKIRCNLVHNLNGALHEPYVPVWVTRGALVAHWYTYGPPRSTVGLLFPSECPSGMILLTPYLMVWGWWVSRAGSMLITIYQLNLRGSSCD